MPTRASAARSACRYGSGSSSASTSPAETRSPSSKRIASRRPGTRKPRSTSRMSTLPYSVNGPASPRSARKYQVAPPSAASTRSTTGTRLPIHSLLADAEHRADAAVQRLLDAGNLSRAERFPGEKARRGRARDPEDEHLTDDRERRQAIGHGRRVAPADARDERRGQREHPPMQPRVEQVERRRRLLLLADDDSRPRGGLFRGEDVHEAVGGTDPQRARRLGG